MKELNKNNLKSKLNQLNEYEPPEIVWQGINARLILTKLPTYDAPEFLWKNIENELAKTQNAKFKTKNLFILRGGNFYKIAAAASIILFVTIGFWFYKIKKNETRNGDYINGSS